MLDLLVAHDPAVVFKVALLDLLHAELTVAIFVEGLEDLGQIVAFLLAHKLRGNERVGGLFQGHVTVEFTEVVEGGHGESLIDLERGQLGDPGVGQGLSRAGSLLRVVGQQGTDEILAVLRDGLPDAVVKVELAFAHLFHDVLIRLAIEWRHSREKNVRDDSSGPNIALVVVILVEDLRGDVVRRAELLVEVAVRVVDERGAEVDDLNLVELLVLLKQDILWLQVTMHNVSLVAVVDAGEDLFHEDCAVTLAELAALEDFVEELATLADLSDEVVALLVLEELVHFDNVWVILQYIKSQNLVSGFALIFK